MITKDSLFTDFIKLIVEAGACSAESPSSGIPFLEDLSKICGEKATCDDVMILHEANDKVNNEWVGWVIINIGREMEDKLRLRYMSKITSPMTALSLLKCDFLTDEETVFLNIIIKDEVRIQKIVDNITDPMEAARLLIDYPHLTDVQEIELKAKFEGRLPTIEKELETRVVLTAKSQKII